MRLLLLMVAALAASGCGLLGSALGRFEMPHAIKLNERSKVSDTGRHVMHSNDPKDDKY